MITLIFLSIVIIRIQIHLATNIFTDFCVFVPPRNFTWMVEVKFLDLWVSPWPKSWNRKGQYQHDLQAMRGLTPCTRKPRGGGEVSPGWAWPNRSDLESYWIGIGCAIRNSLTFSSHFHEIGYMGPIDFSSRERKAIQSINHQHESKEICLSGDWSLDCLDLFEGM